MTTPMIDVLINDGTPLVALPAHMLRRLLTERELVPDLLEELSERTQELTPVVLLERVREAWNSANDLLDEAKSMEAPGYDDEASTALMGVSSSLGYAAEQLQEVDIDAVLTVLRGDEDERQISVCLSALDKHIEVLFEALAAIDKSMNTDLFLSWDDALQGVRDLIEEAVDTADECHTEVDVLGDFVTDLEDSLEQLQSSINEAASSVSDAASQAEDACQLTSWIENAARLLSDAHDCALSGFDNVYEELVAILGEFDECEFDIDTELPEHFEEFVKFSNVISSALHCAEGRAASHALELTPQSLRDSTDWF